MGMKKNSGLFKGTKGNPIAGDASLMNNNDTFLNYIRKRKDVDPKGQFDLIAHGTPNHIELEHFGEKILVDSRTIAKLIKKMSGYKKGQPIRLLSCNTGFLNHGFAQNLSNKLNVTVWAPNNYLWAFSNGKYLVAGKSITKDGNIVPDQSAKGKFIKFTPGGNRK